MACITHDIRRLMRLIQTQSDEYLYQVYGTWWVSTEWLCGTFSGRAFVGATKSQAVQHVAEYFDQHIGHDSIVGHVVTESGWPDLDAVTAYIDQEDD